MGIKAAPCAWTQTQASGWSTGFKPWPHSPIASHVNSGQNSPNTSEPPSHCVSAFQIHTQVETPLPLWPNSSVLHLPLPPGSTPSALQAESVPFPADHICPPPPPVSVSLHTCCNSQGAGTAVTQGPTAAGHAETRGTPVMSPEGPGGNREDTVRRLWRGGCRSRRQAAWETLGFPYAVRFSPRRRLPGSELWVWQRPQDSVFLLFLPKLQEASSCPVTEFGSWGLCEEAPLPGGSPPKSHPPQGGCPTIGGKVQGGST